MPPDRSLALFALSGTGGIGGNADDDSDMDVHRDVTTKVRQQILSEAKEAAPAPVPQPQRQKGLTQKTVLYFFVRK